MTKHVCNQEKTICELSKENSQKSIMMAEMNTKLTTVIDNQKKSDEKAEHNIKRLEEKFDKVCDTFAKTYATKEEVKNLKEQVLRENDKQDKELNWSKSKIFVLVKDVGTIGGILFIIANQLGLIKIG